MVRFKVFYFLLYVSFTTHHFLNLYLREIGLSGVEIGMIKALSSVIMIFSQPFWGVMCDFLKLRKGLLNLLLLFSALTFLLVSLKDSFVWIFMMIGIYGFFKSPLVPVVDSIVMLKVNGDGSRYSQVRLWGGLGLTISVVFMGYYFNQSRAHHLFWVYAVFSLFALLVALVFPQNKSSLAHRKLNLQNLLKLIVHRDFLLFILAILLLQTGAFIVDGFFGLFVIEKIGNKITLGWALNIAGFSEVICYYFLGRCKSVNQPGRFLLISAATSALRWYLYSKTTLVIQVLLLQILHGITFGFFYVSAVTYVDRILSREYATSAQTLLWAIAFGLASVLGSILGGYIYDEWNFRVLFGTAASLALLATSIFLLLKPKTWVD